MNEIKRVPLGVIVIAILCFVQALTLVFVGLFGFALGKSEELFFIGFTGTDFSGLFVVLAILCFGLGIPFIIAGIGLLKKRSWARITVIILSVIEVIFGAFLISDGLIPVGVITLIVSLVTGCYLLFDKSAKEVFN